MEAEELLHLPASITGLSFMNSIADDECAGRLIGNDARQLVALQAFQQISQFDICQ